ncbi:MAG: hypothetical protein Q8M29_15410 [Bacteroidota bacterium]|nr:hypothetical protein [Bacteroidota bacterium]
MKKGLFYFGMTLLGASLIVGCGDSATKGETTGTDSSASAGLPYTIQVDEVTIAGMPDLHSYTHAIYGDKMVMFGGRTSGLHSFGYAFLTTKSNLHVYVVDTKGWADPTTWTVDSLPISKVGRKGPNKNFVDLRQLGANNAEFFTQNNTLYVLGGLLSADNSNDSPITLPYFTAIDLPGLIDCVVSKGKNSMGYDAIRQVKDTSFALTGGEISVMNNVVNLVFGWNYTSASDYYSHQVKTFTFTDSNGTLSAGPITSWNDGHSNGVDSVNEGFFRRRDGSMSAMIDPADGSNFLLYYGGVFKEGATNFTSPVWINATGATEQNFMMRSNVYTCQVIPVYSSSKKESYATLLGGIKNANYTGPKPLTGPTVLTASNADTMTRDVNNFLNVPFTNQFTTIRINANHEFTQYLLPDSFPVLKYAITLPPDTAPYNQPLVLPAGTVMYNGAESEMYWNLNGKYLMSNGVVNYDVLMGDSISGATVGYLHGGILSSKPNVLTTNSNHFSVASNRLFRVRIVPLAN